MPLQSSILIKRFEVRRPSPPGTAPLTPEYSSVQWMWVASWLAKAASSPQQAALSVHVTWGGQPILGHPEAMLPWQWLAVAAQQGGVWWPFKLLG